MTEIKLIQTNITKIPVDVIVNAANSSLLGGGGVDGAIHRAAGPKLVLACLKLGGCKIGKAKITNAYNIETAKYIVHTVGPVYKGMKDKKEAEALLKSCINESLILSEGNKSIAFPFISTGIYGYPLSKAIPSFIDAIKTYIHNNSETTLKEIFLVAYNEQEYKEALEYSHNLL
jgi:O-acetyl-ADP-ribose deacetylase (regulator of RNase III)